MKNIPKLSRQHGRARAAGLDISERGLCWVELRKEARGLVLERCLFEPLPPGCIVEGQVLAFSEVEAALARLLAEPSAALASRTLAPLALAVPAALVTQHAVSLPAPLQVGELAERLQADMADRLQRQAESLCVDFGPDPTRAVGKDQPPAQNTNLIAAAVAKDAVEDRIALVEGAGLPWRVEVMALASQAAVLAACRASQVRAEPPKGMMPVTPEMPVMALVQIEAGCLQLDIVQQAQVLRSQRFELEQAPIAGIQVQPPLALPGGFLEALQATFASTTVARPVQLWLTGPAALTAAWAAELQARADLPCAILDPFEGMTPGDTVHKLPRVDAAQAVVACGLALMALGDVGVAGVAGVARGAAPQPRFNFLPYRETALVQQQKSFVMQLAAVALAVLLASAVMRVALSAQLQTQSEAQAEVRGHTVRLDAELKHLSDQAAEMERLQRQDGVLIKFAQARQQTPRMWQELSTLLPDGVHLTSLQQDAQGAAILSGQARSALEVFALIERLAGSSVYFVRPELLDLSLLAEAPSTPSALATPAAPAAPSPAAPASALAPSAPPAVAAQAGVGERVVFTVRTHQP